MKPASNPFGQPIGFPVPGWTPRPRPPREPMVGRYCRLEPLDPDRHANALFDADADDVDGRSWTYLLWLDPANFDGAGRQRTRLADLTRPLLHRPH